MATELKETGLLNEMKQQGEGLIEDLLSVGRVSQTQELAVAGQSPKELINGSEVERFAAGLGALLWNVEPNEEGRFDRAQVLEAIALIDRVVEDQVNEVIHMKEFQEIESSWRGLHDVIATTNFRANVAIDMMDVTKEELSKDANLNIGDFERSACFQKVYNEEYNQFGGSPYGAIIGLYQYDGTPADEIWLRVMGKIASVSHAPFISSVSTKFFGCDTIEQLDAIKDLKGELSAPKYSSFNALRESEEAAYLGLCLPRYIARLPWDPVANPCGGFNFTERTWGDDNSTYLWGNPAILVAKNLIKSFETSGWCQYIRGPKGGGYVKGLPVHVFNIRGQEESKMPVEMGITYSRELEFSDSGFMSLVSEKGTGNACFFSAQSLKKPKKFRDPKDSENSQLTCNLSYTFSVSRIAHYVQSIMYDNIGSDADASYIQRELTSWIMDYVSQVTNPDDLALRRFPFKAASIEVKDKPGSIGYFSADIAVLPHLQMEGAHVVLRTEARLASKGS